MFTGKTFKLVIVFLGLNALFIGMNWQDIQLYFFDLDSVAVLVTDKKMHRGQPFSKDVVRVKRIPKEQYKSEYYTAKEFELNNSYDDYAVVDKVEPDRFVTRDLVVKKDEKYIHKVLSPNHRSLYLKIKPEQMSKGLFGGWRVDVTVTDYSTKETETILCGIKVLDVGMDKTGTSGQNREGDTHYIIVEVLPDQARELLTGHERGILNFLAISRSEEDYEVGCLKKEREIRVTRGLYND